MCLCPYHTNHYEDISFYILVNIDHHAFVTQHRIA